MTPADAADLRDRWAADQPVDPAEIGAALALLADLLDRAERHGQAMEDLREAFRPLKPALAAGDDWLARNSTDRRGVQAHGHQRGVTPP